MIHYSQNFDILTEKILTAYPDILEYIREKRYTNKDTELTYRQLNSLDEAKLIPDSRKSDKNWRKFNLNDLLYLHTISRSRELNTQNDQLRQVKKLFYDEALNLTVGKIFHSERAILAMLTGMVPVGVLLFSDGEAIMTDDPSITITVGGSDSKNRTYAFISLFQTFQPYLDKVIKSGDFISKYDLKQFDNDYSTKPIDRQERALLKIVENGEYSKISLIKKKDGKFIVEATKSIDGNKLTKSDIKRIIDSHEFGNVETSHRDKDVSNVKVTDIYKI